MSASTSGSKREQLRLVREKQEKEAKIRKIIGLSLAALVALGLILAGVLLVKNKPAEVPEANGAPKYLTSDGSYHILPTGAVDTTADDTTKPGKVRVELFLDPQCPGCGAASRALDAHLLDLAKKGEIDLYMKPVTFLDQASSDKYSSRAANSLVMVANEAPEHFFKYASLLYAPENQPREATEYVPVTDEKLGNIAQQAGVPKEVTAKFADHTYQNWLLGETTRTIARKDLFPGNSFSTPAIFIGGTVSEGKVSGAERVKFEADKPIIDSFNETLKKVQGK